MVSVAAHLHCQQALDHTRTGAEDTAETNIVMDVATKMHELCCSYQDMPVNEGAILLEPALMKLSRQLESVVQIIRKYLGGATVSSSVSSSTHDLNQYFNTWKAAKEEGLQNMSTSVIIAARDTATALLEVAVKVNGGLPDGARWTDSLAPAASAEAIIQLFNKTVASMNGPEVDNLVDRLSTALSLSSSFIISMRSS